jgi:hypothetical protein
VFFSSTLGSKYFGGVRAHQDHDAWEKSYHVVANTPSVWIGEVSWLKAAITGEHENYVPDVVSRVYDVIGEDLPVLDQELFEKLKACWNEPFVAAGAYDFTELEKVEPWLKDHMGKQLFTVSW